MKIKDLPKETRLAGIVFLHPDTHERCEWVSAWDMGVWWRVPNSGPVAKVEPIFVASLEQAMEWEVAP